MFNGTMFLIAIRITLPFTIVARSVIGSYMSATLTTDLTQWQTHLRKFTILTDVATNLENHRNTFMFREF